MNSKELIKGTLRVIVLKLLAEHKRMYGYEMTQRVKEITNDEIALTFGALYPTLHKLEAEGLVTTTTMTVDGRPRKYYSLTHTGEASAKAEVRDYAAFARAMGLIMNF